LAMAKQKAKDEKVTTEGKPRWDKASEAEAQLRAYHALGIVVRDRVKEGRLDADTVSKLGEETGHGADNIRKARVFAARYTADQLDELCGLRTPEGIPLPWRHVRMLLMLPPGEGRDALQRKAAEKGWSLEELVAAIPKKVRNKQTRHQGGRGFRRPKTQAAALRQIVRYGEAWQRRYRKAWEEFDWLESKPGAAGPGGLDARIAEARQTLRTLGAATKRLDARLKKLEHEQAGR